MSLQNDFELCLEYAETLENKRDQQVKAQNNIIFMQNESERLKNKIRICTTLCILAAIGMSILTYIMIGVRTVHPIEFLPFLGALIIVFSIAFFNRVKTKKESNEFEAKKPLLIQQYTATAEKCEHEMISLIQEIYNEDLFEIVPADYFSVAAIEFCLTRVRKKMANTATEAFRQLEAEIKHIEHMEYEEQMNNARIEQLNNIERAIHIHTLVTLAEQEKNKS